MTCSVRGCLAPVDSLGACGRHYRAARAYWSRYDRRREASLEEAATRWLSRPAPPAPPPEPPREERPKLAALRAVERRAQAEHDAEREAEERAAVARERETREVFGDRPTPRRRRG